MQKKSDFVQKAGHFHDLAGRVTSGKKSGTVPPKAGRLAGLHNNLNTPSCWAHNAKRHKPYSTLDNYRRQIPNK